MKHFLRPYRNAYHNACRDVGFVLVLGAGLIFGPQSVKAQSVGVVELLPGTSPLLRSSSQGYLGVDLADVDQEKAQTLKLKEVRGAVITLIDHDAPAGQIGLKVNDVVLQLNGQNVEGAEQLRRMLREIPPGRKVSLEFSRDGNIQTTSVQLVDRHVMEHDVWNKLGTDSDASGTSPGMGVLPGAGDASLPGMFHMPIFGSTLHVGAMVEPLTGQMADYLGVTSGLMVKQVAAKSEAAAAGFKAHDVILKVGADAVTTLSDWDRALRSNQGKQVQVTILRDRKQQTLNLQVDSKRKSGALQLEELFPSGDCSELAQMDANAAQIFGGDEPAAQALRKQLDGMTNPQSGAELAEQLRQQSEEFRDQLKLDDFKVDQKIADDLKKQMDEWNRTFSADSFKNAFKFDQNQFDDLKKQMEEFRNNSTPEPQIAPY
jgi:membrane-associated protease RseP (regulator of RpoE activity)